MLSAPSPVVEVSTERETVLTGPLTTSEEGFFRTGDFAGGGRVGDIVPTVDCAASAAAAAALERGVPVVATTFLGPAPPPIPLPLLETAGERFPFVLLEEIDRAFSNPSFPLPRLKERFRDSIGDPRRDRVGEPEVDRPPFDGRLGECEAGVMVIGEEGVMEVVIL